MRILSDRPPVKQESEGAKGGGERWAGGRRSSRDEAMKLLKTGAGI